MVISQMYSYLSFRCQGLDNRLWRSYTMSWLHVGAGPTTCLNKGTSISSSWRYCLVFRSERTCVNYSGGSMKRFLIIGVSVVALIFLCVTVVYGWQASCSTTWNGRWHSCSSAAVEATGTSATSIVNAPSSDHNCGSRGSTGRRAGDNFIVSELHCADGTPSGTASCCQAKQWASVVGTSYYVTAEQSPDTYSDCGPTTGTIEGGSWNCNQQGPGHE